VAAIKDNFFQREIAEASFRYQAEVEAGQRVIVGVNRYQLDEESELPILKIDPALEREQVARVQALRGRRDSAEVESALSRLADDAAVDDRNLMPPIVAAARAYATVGEMCDVLRRVWGTWRETPVF
jgi:methylmalonyl-CoA mutase, N-terminal domain